MPIFVGHRNTEMVRTSLKFHGQIKMKKGWRANLGEEGVICEEALLESPELEQPASTAVARFDGRFSSCTLASPAQTAPPRGCRRARRR
jgi:hypothetical protein